MRVRSHAHARTSTNATSARPPEPCARGGERACTSVTGSSCALALSGTAARGDLAHEAAGCASLNSEAQADTASARETRPTHQAESLLRAQPRCRCGDLHIVRTPAPAIAVRSRRESGGMAIRARPVWLRAA